MACGWNGVGCHVKSGIVSGVKSLFESQIDGIERQVGEAVASALNSLSSFWLTLDAPELATDTRLSSDRAWTPSGPVEFLESRTYFVVFALAVVSVIVGGIRMAWESRGDPARELLRSLLTLVLVMSAGTAVVQMLATAADSFSLWLVNASLPPGSTFEHELGKLVLFGNRDLNSVGAGGLPKLVFIQFAILLFFASLVQIMLMLVRSGMLVLLAGTFPLAASMTNTEMGRAWFKKYCGWIVAFVAYKPVAALIYAAAFKMMQEGLLGGAKDLIGLVTGMMMMLMTIFALPALLRLVVPMTAAVAGGSMAMGLGGDGGLLPTGARLLGRSGGGGGSGGGFGGPPGGGSGGATGAIGVGAAMGAVAGAAAGGMQRAGSKVSQAVSHSAGEDGGSAPGGGGRPSGGGGSRRPPARKQSGRPRSKIDGPTGSG